MTTTVELLTRAADAARGAAEAAAQAPVAPAEWPTVDGFEHFLTDAEARLAAASGPDHWRAVAAMLRVAVERHGRALNHDCAIWAVRNSGPCEWVLSLLPLAELIVQQLGGEA